MGVSFSRSLRDRLLGEAASSRDHEVCGLLFGCDASIAAAEPARNVAADPATTFEIDPAMLLAAHRAERAGGRRIVGCYHSHPSGAAIPSARDVAAAEPGRLWLIIGAGEARLWRAGTDGFAPVAVRWR